MLMSLYMAIRFLKNMLNIDDNNNNSENCNQNAPIKWKSKHNEQVAVHQAQAPPFSDTFDIRTIE